MAKLLEGPSDLLTVQKTSFCSWERTRGDGHARKGWVKVLGLECWGAVRENLGNALEEVPSPQMLVGLCKVITSFSKAATGDLT